MGLIGGMARTAVAAATWTAVSNSVSRRQAGHWAEQDQTQQRSAYMPPPPGRYQRPMFQHHYAPPPPPPPPQPVRVPVDMSAKLAQLQQLGALKSRGVLTETEFQTQKQRILDS